MEKFKVVRTFMGENGRDKLQDAFDAGYILVRASEFVPDAKRGNSTYLGYIEYILAKENPEETYEAGYKKGFSEGCVQGEEKGRAEGYFDGQAYGWEKGREALIADVKAETAEEIYLTDNPYTKETKYTIEHSKLLEILDRIGKAEEEGKEVDG